MKFKNPVYGNNGLKEMTNEELVERNSIKEQFHPQLTDDERITQLEQQNEELTLIIADILGGAI